MAIKNNKKQKEEKDDKPKAKTGGPAHQNKKKKKNKGGNKLGPVEDQTTKSIAEAEEITDRAEDRGDKFADKYLPEGTFGKLPEGTTPEMKALLEELNRRFQESGTLQPNELEALENLRASLGGYTSPEVQAMREAGMQELDRQLQTQTRATQIAQGRSGVSGAAASAQMANLGQQRMATQGNIERDLIIKNADEVFRRKQAFADLVGNTEAARFSRSRDMGSLYGGALAGEEGVQRATQQYNIGQGQNEALARSGLALSGAGLYTGIQQGQETQNIGQEFTNRTIEQMNKQNQIMMEELRRAREAQNRAFASTGY